MHCAAVTVAIPWTGMVKARKSTASRRKALGIFGHCNASCFESARRHRFQPAYFVRARVTLVKHFDGHSRRAVSMMVRMDDRVAFASRDQPPVYREGRYSSDRKPSATD